MGVESTSPFAQVGHLADLLKNRVNSQRYPGIYKDWKPKTVEDIEKSDGKESASGELGPWDQCRNQDSCSPRPSTCWVCHRILGRELG